jgi:hypothetical protein
MILWFLRKSNPQGAVEGAVADGFEEVGWLDGVGGGEVGDGAADFEDAVVGAGAEVEFVHGLFQHGGTFGAEGAELLEGAVGHAGVGFVFGSGEARGLSLPGGEDACPDGGGGLGRGIVVEIAELHGGCFDMDVDAIEERSGDFGAVAFDLRGRAAALPFGVPEISTRVWQYF